MSDADTQRQHIRYDGLDFARSLAILGMVLVNFSAVTEEGESPEWLLLFLGAIQGRAAAVFVMLAGTGISLLSRRARIEQNAALFHDARAILLKRAAFLLLMGVSLVYWGWRPDILHYYALYMTAAVFLLRSSSRCLLAVAASAIVAFVVLFFLLDYDAGWTEAGRYAGFRTILGTVRRMFFDGYYPFFPWLAFLVAGMWLGRLDLADSRMLMRTTWISLTLALCLETVSWYLTGLSDFVELHGDTDPSDLWATHPYPPGPLFVLTSIGFGFTIILLSTRFAAAFPESWLTRTLVPTGQLALSIYFAHATAGISLLRYLGEVFEESSSLAATAALAFCVVSVAVAVPWRLRFARGPVETVMRRATGS